MISITTLEDLQTMVDEYLTHDAFVFDVETIPQDPEHDDWRGDWQRNQVVWISFATDGRADIVPFGHPNGEYVSTEYPLNAAGLKRVAENLEREKDGRKQLVINDKTHRSVNPSKAILHFSDPPEQLRWGPEVRAILEPLFNSDLLKIAHNAPFDLKSSVKHLGFVPVGPFMDTIMAGFLVNSQNRGRMDLATCCERELGYKMTKGVGKRIEVHSFSEVEKYGWLDSKMEWLLAQEYLEQINKMGLTNLNNLDSDIIEAVIHMEMTGAPIKVDRLQELDVYLRGRIDDVLGEIYRIAGQPFNVDSTAELATTLFGPKPAGMGIKAKTLTDGGQKRQDAGEPPSPRDYSTAEAALNAIAGTHPIIDAVIAYGDLKKLHSGFIIPYLGGEVTRTTNGKTKTTQRPSLLINNRLYSTFKPDGAVTGRFSSKNPNLQQVPVRSEDGKKIRACFSAEDLDDLIIVQADYSQIEPRILADLSGERALLDCYLDGGNGVDFYTAIASPFGLTRDDGKTMFLSVCYGVGPEKLASKAGIPLKAAKDIIYEDFGKKFSDVARFKKFTISEAKGRKPPHIRTLLGRRAYYPELLSNTEWRRNAAGRQAFNARIQGSAADIMKVGLVRCHKAITPMGGKIFATVHDEVLALAPKGNAEEIAHTIEECLTGVRLLQKVPLVAETKVVTTWAEAKG